jgi:uncharacterized membrane protein YcaP (DUF421 family)
MLIATFLQFLFGGDMPQEPLTLLQISCRAIFVYFGGLIIVRIGKSRLVGRLTPLDIILGFILGSLLSRGITGHASISGTMMGSTALIAAHWSCTALAYHSHRFGNLIKGHAYLVVDRGRMLRENMRHSEISEEDLCEELRLHGVNRLDDVEQAIKERNGQISVICRNH